MNDILGRNFVLMPVIQSPHPKVTIKAYYVTTDGVEHRLPQDAGVWQEKLDFANGLIAAMGIEKIPINAEFTTAPMYHEHSAEAVSFISKDLGVPEHLLWEALNKPVGDRHGLRILHQMYDPKSPAVRLFSTMMQIDASARPPILYSQLFYRENPQEATIKI